MMHSERPKTGHRRRKEPQIFDSSAGYSSYERTADVSSEVLQMEAPSESERPMTSRGRRNRAPPDHVPGESVDYNEFSERPKTSHRNRNFSGNDVETASPERPKTSHGSRHYEEAPEEDFDDSARHQSTGEVNILKIEDNSNYSPQHTAVSNPRTNRRSISKKVRQEAGLQQGMPSYNKECSPTGRSRGSTNIMQHQSMEEQYTSRSYASPSPRTPYPGTRRPSVPASNAHRPISDVDANLVGDVFSPRPSSAASISKYSVLPSIGVRTPKSPYPEASRIQQKRKSAKSKHVPSAKSDQSRKVDSVSVSPAVKSNNSKLVSSAKSKQALTTDSKNPEMEASSTGRELRIDGEAKIAEHVKASSSHPEKQLDTAQHQNQHGGSFEEAATIDKSVINDKPVAEAADDKRKEEDVTSSETDSDLWPLRREVTLPLEPESDEPRFRLAVKLPDGQRVQRFFRLGESLNTVVEFAEVESKLDLGGYELVCTMPHRIIKDLSQSVGESGLQDKTVLHLQLPDEP